VADLSLLNDKTELQLARRTLKESPNSNLLSNVISIIDDTLADWDKENDMHGFTDTQKEN
jgi:hypothetical protein